MQGGEYERGDERKDEEKRSTVSESFETREKWEEEDEDRRKEKNGGNCNRGKRGRYGRDKIFTEEYVVASAYQKPVPFSNVFLGVKDSHLLATSCAAM